MILILPFLYALYKTWYGDAAALLAMLRKYFHFEDLTEMGVDTDV